MKNNKKTKIKFRNSYTKRKINYTWIFSITFVTFLLAMSWEYFSRLFMLDNSLLTSIIVLTLIIFFGIFFDLLGIAVTASKEKPFHAMASRKVRGAKESIILVRNAGSVANFFNDVIGDIAGIVSGVTIITILIKMNETFTIKTSVMSILLTATVAALTVGGKAIGKEIGIRKSNEIVFKLGFFLSFFTHRKK
jgi:CBS domain containing-hemolysin-like protein